MARYTYMSSHGNNSLVLREANSLAMIAAHVCRLAVIVLTLTHASTATSIRSCIETGYCTVSEECDPHLAQWNTDEVHFPASASRLSTANNRICFEPRLVRANSGFQTQIHFSGLVALRAHPALSVFALGSTEAEPGFRKVT